MNSIYVILLTFLLYVFFGTIADFIIGTNNKRKLVRIKTKVLFYKLIAPVIFALAVFYILFTDNKPIYIFLGVGLILSSLIRIFYAKRNYLTEFRIDNEYLNIHYLTPFLKTQLIKFDLRDISAIELAKANWLIDYPATVNVRYKEIWVKFEVIDKNLKAQIQTDAETFMAGTEVNADGFH